VRPLGDKLVRARPLAAQAYAKNVKLLVADWNEKWLAHMHAVPDGPHDDNMDASAGAFNELVKELTPAQQTTGSHSLVTIG
jgi:predicted phage terminase large subunit-like protein